MTIEQLMNKYSLCLDWNWGKY